MIRVLLIALLFSVPAFGQTWNQVDTLTNLLARGAIRGGAYIIKGYRSPGDWGGDRIAKHYPGSNETTNQGNVFSLSDGRLIFADRTNTVQHAGWWGLANGATDVNATLQAAADYGQTLGGVTVAVPAGSYTLTPWPPIYVTNNTTLVGVPGQTVFNFSGATNQVQYGVAIHNATNASVSGVSYWWPTNTLAVPDPETVIAVDIRNSQNVTIDQVKATNLKGLNVGGTQGSSDVYISRFTGTASPQVGGAATYVSHMIVSDSVFQGSSGDHTLYNVVGFDIEPNTGQTVTDVVFSRCRFLNNEEDGLTLVSSADRTMSNIRLVECFSSNNGTSGLSIQAGEDIVVTGWQSTNDYSGFAFSGYGSIYATLSKNLTIQGCTIRGNANNSGINLAGVSGITVTGNTIDGVTLDGIQIADATSRRFTGVTSLIGNRILRPGRYGLYYSGVVGVQALGNTIIQAGQNGIHSTFGINNVFANNLIAESGDSGNGYYGMRLAASSTNSVYGNTFLENLVSLNTTNQAGTVSTVKFGANGMGFDGYYNDCWVTITSGTGNGQTRQVSGFVGSTLVATVSTNWVTTPDGTSVLRVESGNPNYTQSGAIYLDDSRCVNNNVADNNLGGLSVVDSGTSTKGVMLASTYPYSIDSQSFGVSPLVRESDGETTEFRSISTGVGKAKIYGLRTSSGNHERLSLTVTPGVAGFVAMETAGTGADNLKLVLTGSGTESVYATYGGQSEVVSRWSGALATAPATPQIGDAFYDTALSALAFWNGTSWIYPQNRTNHYGTQTLSTISDAGTAASRNVPSSGDASSTQVVLGSDTRLTDSRTPTSHTHPASEISDSTSAGRSLLTAANAAAQRSSLGLGSIVLLNEPAHDNTTYALSNGLWVAVGGGTGSGTISMGVYGGTIWPDINDVRFANNDDTSWEVSELTPIAFPQVFVKNPFLVNGSGISSYSAGMKWNLTSNTVATAEYGYGNARPVATGTNVEVRIPQRVSLIVTNPSSGTFTNPPWGRTIKGFLWGPGGGGGSGRKGLTNTAAYGGGGGASGSFTPFEIANLSGGEIFAWTNGAGGIGGTAQTGNSTDGVNGTTGTNTSFGSYVGRAGGGGNGGTASSAAAGAAVAGGYTSLAGGAGASGNGANGAGTVSSGGTAAKVGGGGGGGAGRGADNSTGNGGNGGTGDRSTAGTSGGSGATSYGTAGTDGGSSTQYGMYYITGGGGGGGGRGVYFANAGSGGAGGNGGFPSGGGGGGANGTNSTGVPGSDSGAGGNGGNGAIIIIVE